MNSKSPLKKAPLRQAGQSLEEEIERVRDGIGENITMAGALFSALAIEVIQWWVGGRIPVIVWITLMTLPIVFFAWKAFRLRRIWRQLRLGRAGEKMLGHQLDELRASGFKVLHDLRGHGFNVDHVLIGPKGVFAVETKTWRIPAGGRVIVENDSVRVGKYLPDRDVMGQARGEARWLSKLIKEQTGRQIPVKPVVIFLGWYVEHKGPKDVWVLNENAFPKWLDNESIKLTPEDVSLIYAGLAMISEARDTSDAAVIDQR